MSKRLTTRLVTTAGKRIDRIPVQLSYQIIQHFSAGLYTSPNKAIEELVANSYDAWARKVHVILPDDVVSPEATISVIDDGESMDVEGFHDLWLIGESRKRDSGRDVSERPPIGKFGIGKLATYVLAKQLTYLCKKGGKYRAVTMDFGRLEESRRLKRLRLDVREMTKAQARAAVAEIIGHRDLKEPCLFGKDSAKSWTVAALSNLTPLARKLTPGRLQYVLRTALPVSPQFALYFCGDALAPEKLSRPLVQEWILGEDDEAAKSVDFPTRRVAKRKRRVIIPELGAVHGTCQLFQDPLPGGKAEDWGRSHGFFVMVRGRLINLHDELFGLEQLSHGAFSRFRMVIYADGLDNYLRATRETVLEEEEGVKNVRVYLRAKFNEVRSRYETWLTEKEKEESLSSRVSRTPRSLSRQPLVSAIRRVLDGEIESLALTRVPAGLTLSEKGQLLQELESNLESDEFFQEVSFEALGIEHGIAVFEAHGRRFKVNILHPFFANYCDHTRTHEAFILLAVTEVLTEAYLLEEGLSPERAQRVLNRRDRFLRELVFGTQLAAPLVAQLLDENMANPKGLEKALHTGLASLGFEVAPRGGKGEPDGIALARMGVRDQTTGRSENYSITYDAKSTANGKVSAKDIGAATIAQHRSENNADFSLVVAPGFEGDGDPDSNAVKQAMAQAITLMTVKDFISLVLIAATRPLGFQKLRDELFLRCRGPLDASTWIDGILAERVAEAPLPEILETTWRIQHSSPDPPKFASIRERLAVQDAKFKNLREQEIREWLQSVQRFAGTLVWIDGDRVCLNNPPQKILEAVRGHTNLLPLAVRRGSMYAALGDGGETGRHAGKLRRK